MGVKAEAGKTSEKEGVREIERVLKTLANKRRLAIVKYLKSKREASVGDIADEIDLSFKATSKHLVTLNAANIVEREQKGFQAFYRLANYQKPIAKYIASLL